MKTFYFAKCSLIIKAAIIALIGIAFIQVGKSQDAKSIHTDQSANSILKPNQEVIQYSPDVIPSIKAEKGAIVSVVNMYPTVKIQKTVICKQENTVEVQPVNSGSKPKDTITPQTLTPLKEVKTKPGNDDNNFK
jgi:hypothetical protein